MSRLRCLAMRLAVASTGSGILRAACIVLAGALPVTPPALAAAAEAGDDRVAILAQAGIETDADDFDGAMLRGGALFGYESYLHYDGGIAVQNTHYQQDRWSEDVPGIFGLYRNQQRGSLAGVRAEAGLVSVAGHARPVGDVTWSLRPRDTTGVELIAAGDVVGTEEAIERGITYGLLAVSAEQQFGSRVTGIALAGWQPFTDGNARNLLRARLIVALAPEDGVSAQIRWRQYASREDDVDGAYFNPDRYRNWDAGLSCRRHVGGWTIYGLAGMGQERIDSGTWQSTGIAEVRAEGPLAGDRHLAVGLVYSRAAGFTTSPDYWYGAINVSVIVPLK